MAEGAGSIGTNAGKGGGQTVTPQPNVPSAGYTNPNPAGAGQYSPITSSGQPNVYDQSAAALTGAQNATNNVINNGPNVGGFMNPFTDMVGSSTMDAMERARAIAMSQTGGQAAGANAFGGSRHGVADAETNRAYFDSVGSTMGNLYNQGFNTSLGAAQQQQQTQLQGAGQLGQLSNLGFGFGQQIGQTQSQQGQLQQAIQQALIDAGKGQFEGFVNKPEQALQLPLAATGAANMGQNTSTTTKKAGLFDYLTLGATALGCWVAEEVYGVGDSRVPQFRSWLHTGAPAWFRDAYIRHGVAWAAAVNRLPFTKRILRPLMDRARAASGFKE